MIPGAATEVNLKEDLDVWNRRTHQRGKCTLTDEHKTNIRIGRLLSESKYEMTDEHKANIRIG